ncbi:hypothetical protein [Acinetobacter oleivorans]|uniref:hypothetical protein n=1 Tax=Acinetobacter oleivorans TaxID=1148157 RepID=UPI0020906B09|nr:hypothetical protein [Acinetobacter oleivorans]
MNQETKSLLIDICGWIISINTIFFFFILWLYSYNGIDNPLKEAWSLTISLLSASTTIGAAIIAASLFNHWKDSQTGVNRSELAKNIQINLIELKNLCDYHFDMLKGDIILDKAKEVPDISKVFIAKRNERYHLYEDEKKEFIAEYSKQIKKLILSIRVYESIFSIILLPENETFHFNSYSYHLAAIYTALKDQYEYEKLKQLEKSTEKLKKDMENIYMRIITDETSQYINLVGVK